MRRSAKLALAALERAARARGLAPATLARRLGVARRFLAGLRSPLRRVATDDVRRYLASRTESGAGATTLAVELSVLRGLFSVLVEAKLVAADPTERIALPRAHSRPPIVLSETGVKELLVAAHAPPGRCSLPPERALALRLRDRACLELLYGLGLRASELRVRVADLNLAEGTLLVRRAKRGGGAFLPLPSAALPHVERYLREGRPALVRPGADHQGALFLGQYGRPIHNGVVTKLVERAAANAGVRAHPHAFRRAVATHLVRRGASVPIVQALLGHARLDTTARYVGVDREDLKKAVETLEQARGGGAAR